MKILMLLNSLSYQCDRVALNTVSSGNLFFNSISFNFSKFTDKFVNGVKVRIEKVLFFTQAMNLLLKAHLLYRG